MVTKRRNGPVFFKKMFLNGFVEFIQKGVQNGFITGGLLVQAVTTRLRFGRTDDG